MKIKPIDLLVNLSSSIRAYIGDNEVIRAKHGQSDSNVFKIYGNPANLNWLKGKLNVQEVVDYQKNEEYEFLVVNEVLGNNCFEELKCNSKENVVIATALGLKKNHSIPIKNCPFDQRLNEKLKQAKCRVDNYLVDGTDFDKKRLGLKVYEVLSILLKTKPSSEDLVFTHGDYCLDNIIINNGKISGVIDLDRAGIADRYHDLGIISRDIGKNYLDLFFQTYGINNKPDSDKIEYFQILDKMF